MKDIIFDQSYLNIDRNFYRLYFFL